MEMSLKIKRVPANTTKLNAISMLNTMIPISIFRFIPSKLNVFIIHIPDKVLAIEKR